MSAAIKYQPLKSSDFEDGDLSSSTTNENAKDSFQIHWSLKFLCLGFIAMQLVYVGYISRIDYTFRNTTTTTTIYSDNATTEDVYPDEYDIEIITLNGLMDTRENNNTQESTTSAAVASVTNHYGLDTSSQDNKVWTKDDFIASTTFEPPYATSTLFEQHQYNSTFPDTGFTSVINSETTIISMSTISTSNAKIDDDYDLGIVQPSMPGIGLEKNSTNKKSHDINKDLTINNTSIANYTNATAATNLNAIVATANPPTTPTAITFSTPATLEPWSTTLVALTTSSQVATSAATTITTTSMPINLNTSTTMISDHLATSSLKYFINTSRCHIPYVDPFTSEVRKMFKPSHTTGCTKDQAITSSSFDHKRRQYILHINYTVAMTLVENSTEHSIVEDLQCCYRQIERGGSGARSDSTFVLLPCSIFHQDFVVPLHIQGIIVDCTSKSMKKLLQQDAFSFVQVQPQHNSDGTNDTVDKDNTNGLKKLGILLLGIDSLSRINFRRNMPETLKYLVDKGWYELKGYNKVGDNTLPNLMPLLAGYTRTSTYAKCNSKSHGYDDCNFMWTKFGEHGFKTGYAEDTTTISTFNYKAKGFRKPPTDHYLRPFALGIEKTMKKTQKAGLYYCVGRRQYGEYIYDYGVEFATRYQNQSNFGFFWTNSFSHNAYSTAATMDRTMVKYLKDLEAKGIFETSVVMFFSDHGRRWGPLLKLSEGFLEERLPMFFVSLPSWFNKEYKANLIENQKRLTTPFDIHMTLQHLLHMTVPAYNITQAYDCAKAQSIFQEIPENRTCYDACIPEAWCTCIPYMVVPTKNATIKRVTQLIVNEMNHYYATKNITSLCSKLTIHEISRAKLRLEDSTSQSSTVTTYMIEFATNPKTKPPTLFSATAKYDAKIDKIEMNVDDISRLSEYKNTAECIDDKQAKKYCICKDSLKS